MKIYFETRRFAIGLQKVFLKEKRQGKNITLTLVIIDFTKRAQRDSNPRQTWYRKPVLYPTELWAHRFYKFDTYSIITGF